jgi:hypothetical protein
MLDMAIKPRTSPIPAHLPEIIYITIFIHKIHVNFRWSYALFNAKAEIRGNAAKPWMIIRVAIE